MNTQAISMMNPILFINRLKNAGFTHQQAEIQIEIQIEILNTIVFEHLASKEELKNAVIMLRSEMTDMKTELRQEMTNMKSELRQEMTNMKADLRQEMMNIKVELHYEIITVKSSLQEEINELRLSIYDLERRLLFKLGFLITGLLTFFESFQHFIRI